MSTLIRTDEVPAADLGDFFRQLTATTWVPMECGPFTGDYRGAFRKSGLGAMQVVVMDIMPISVRRTPQHIEQADPDMIKLALVCSGNSCVISQDGRQAKVAPGEFAFYDTRRPYEVRCGADGDTPLQLMSFMFPPSLLPLPRSALRQLAAVRFGASAGLGDLTAQFLLQLARNVDHYSPAEAARLSTAALEVLATRLAREQDVGACGTQEARRHALLTTVQAFIQQRLADPGLTPSLIAAAHHISLRSLHQLFHDEGLTVAGWVRQRRLESCRQDLSNPALAERPVAAIAARWGFSSACDFSRAFRAVHGLPPAEYRMSALAVKCPAR